MRPHRRQPTRLPHPWDSPGKNTRVGCHFLLQCRKVKSESEVAQSCPTLSDPMDCSPPGSSIHGIFQARVLEWGAIAFSQLYLLVFQNYPLCPGSFYCYYFCLGALGLSCSAGTFQLRRVGSGARGRCCSTACGISLPQPWTEPRPPALQAGFLTTGPNSSPEIKAATSVLSWCTCLEIFSHSLILMVLYLTL